MGWNPGAYKQDFDKNQENQWQKANVNAANYIMALRLFGHCYILKIMEPSNLMSLIQSQTLWVTIKFWMQNLVFLFKGDCWDWSCYDQASEERTVCYIQWKRFTELNQDDASSTLSLLCVL